MNSDHLIENRIGCAIREYFGEEGEQAFRDLEASVLLELLNAKQEGVLATGCCVVLRPESRARMHTAGQVVHLHVSSEEIARRLRHDTKRRLDRCPIRWPSSINYMLSAIPYTSKRRAGLKGVPPQSNVICSLAHSIASY